MQSQRTRSARRSRWRRADRCCSEISQERVIDMTTSNSMNISARGGRTDFSFDSPELKGAGVGGVFMGDDPHGPLVWFQELPPNIVAPAHSHDTDYLTVVIEGSLRVGRKWYGPGS